VISVGQLHAIGFGRGDIVRLERRGALRRLHPRVYVDHTGPLTRQQRLWAALLFAEPAVVCGPTLLDADADGDIHIAIDATRRLVRVEGVQVHRVRNLDAVAQWKASPPRMRREDNVVAMVDQATTELDVVRLLTDASRDRKVGAARIPPGQPSHCGRQGVPGHRVRSVRPRHRARRAAQPRLLGGREPGRRP
jgi:hypothetical protein